MELDGKLILEAIQHSVIAGRCRAYAITHSTAAPGLLRAADKHSAKSADKLTRWVMGAHVAFPGNVSTRTHG